MKTNGKRSELNYVISGAIVLILGGLIVKTLKEDPSAYMFGIVAGALMMIGGVYLLGKGVLSGRR